MEVSKPKGAEEFKEEIGYSSSEEEPPSSNIGMRRKWELARWEEDQGRRQNKRRLEAKQLDKKWRLDNIETAAFQLNALAVLVQ